MSTKSLKVLIDSFLKLSNLLTYLKEEVREYEDFLKTYGIPAYQADGGFCIYYPC